MHHALRRLSYFLTVTASFNSLFAQSAAVSYVNFPRSIYSYGIGKQGVTSRDPIDALLYNPANLVFASDPQISFNRQPGAKWNQWLTSLSAAGNIPRVGYFGLDYTNYYLGNNLSISDLGHSSDGIFQTYEWALSVAYARSIINHLVVGGQFRYATDRYGAHPHAAYLFSGGVRYDPPILKNRFSVGFALINFGSAMTYGDPSLWESPPAQMMFGIACDVFKNRFMTLTLSSEASKSILYKKWNAATRTHVAESSFKAFFDDWQHTPQDINLHNGLSFSWNPIPLGNGFSFFQRMYLGEISGGSYSALAGQFTHGVEAGCSWNGVQLTLGYAGTWHYFNSADEAAAKSFTSLPQEDAQLSLSAPLELFLEGKNSRSSLTKTSNIVLTGGVIRMIRFGHFHTSEMNGAGQYFPNTYGYGIEASLYFTKTSALVSSLSYTQMEDEAYYLDTVLQRHTIVKAQLNNVSLTSSYRNHPLTTFFPLFYEVGFGITRWETTKERTIPKYMYHTIICGNIGALINLRNYIQVIPKAGFESTLMSVTGKAPRIGGYNQWNFSMNVGYRF